MVLECLKFDVLDCKIVYNRRYSQLFILIKIIEL